MEIPRDGGGGGQKANFLNESMTLKGNFRRDGGFNLKDLTWEGCGYFLEQYIIDLVKPSRFRFVQSQTNLTQKFESSLVSLCYN